MNPGTVAGAFSEEALWSCSILLSSPVTSGFEAVVGGPSNSFS